MVYRRGGGGAGGSLHHIAGEDLLPPGLLQGVGENAVVLSHRVAAQPLRLLLVEILLHLQPRQLPEADIAQSGDQVVADDHGVAVGGAGGAAGQDHLFQPVVQPLAHGQILADLPGLQLPPGRVVLQSADRLLQGGVAADCPLGDPVLA